MPCRVHSLLLSLWAATLVSAQFQFFDQMFGHGQQHHQQQHRGSGTSQWAAQADVLACSEYLCPDTLQCVSNPKDCPCPNVEDVKCLIPDSQEKGSATVICTRGHNGCSDVERLMRNLR